MITPYLSPVPLIAILRGLTPKRASDVGAVLYDAGFRVVEVPMNSPAPLESVKILRERLSDDCLVGAGTVTHPAQCDEIFSVGGRLIVSPHTDPMLITYAQSRGCVVVPGVFTPTDIFTAIQAGAHALKLFPSHTGGVQHYLALKAITPPHIPVLAVGGVQQDNAKEWLNAGVHGLGIGSAVFKAEWSINTIEQKAREWVSMIREIR